MAQGPLVGRPRPGQVAQVLQHAPQVVDVGGDVRDGRGRRPARRWPRPARRPPAPRHSRRPCSGGSPGCSTASRPAPARPARPRPRRPRGGAGGGESGPAGRSRWPRRRGPPGRRRRPPAARCGLRWACAEHLAAELGQEGVEGGAGGRIGPVDQAQAGQEGDGPVAGLGVEPGRLFQQLRRGWAGWGRTRRPGQRGGGPPSRRPVTRSQLRAKVARRATVVPGRGRPCSSARAASTGRPGRRPACWT